MRRSTMRRFGCYPLAKATAAASAAAMSSASVMGDIVHVASPGIAAAVSVSGTASTSQHLGTTAGSVDVNLVAWLTSATNFASIGPRNGLEALYLANNGVFLNGSNGNLDTFRLSNSGPSSGFAGFRTVDGQRGWFQWKLTVSPNVVASAEILQYAYEENPGVGFNVGQTASAAAVPEPSTLSLAVLATGAAGVASWRRRKKEISKTEQPA